MNDNKLIRPISVYLDSNVWDFLFDNKLDLSDELPRDEFCVCVTRDAEIEIPAIPPEKAELKAFIEATIDKCSAQPEAYFDYLRFAKPMEVAFIQQQNMPLRERKMMIKRLLRNRAEIALPALALHSVVLTLDKKLGLINDAYKKGGKVVSLTAFQAQVWRLEYFVKSKLGLVRLP